MPVRKIGFCYRSVGGRVPVGPGQASVGVESTLERDFVLLQRFDPSVSRIEEQPLRLDYRTAHGERRRYVPDFLVSHRDGRSPTRLVEVKYSTDPRLVSGELEERFGAARRYAAGRGWTFEVATEREIRTPKLANATFLLPFRERALDPTHREALVDALRGLGQASVQDLLGGLRMGFADRAKVLPSLWTLVARFEVSVNLDEPITMRSLLRLPGEGRP